MDIEKLETPGETPLLRFYDLTKTELTLWASEDVKQGKSTKVLYFDIDTDYVKFLQEDIKTLLPYLQAFAETGQLEPQDLTLQGESLSVDFVKRVIKRHIDHYENEEDEEGFDTCEAILRDLGLPETKYAYVQGEEAFLDVSKELATMQDAGVAMAANIVEQGNRIQALEQLVKEWRKLLEDRDTVSNASEHHVWEECESELREKTSQLLGE